MKTLVRRIGLLLLLISVVSSAEAADEPQSGSQELSNPFSDFVPFEDEYDVDEDERFMYFGRFFAVSVGTGMHSWGGNIGKLYNTALPVLDFRMTYFFDFRLAANIGFNSSSHAFTADEIGSVEIRLFRLNFDLKYYFDTKNAGAAISSANPYIIAGVSQVMRSQAFQSNEEVTKDNAIALSGGAGLEFALKPRKTSLGLEGRIHQIYFRDRLKDTYSTSGVENTTGNMYSMLATMIWFF